MRPISLLFHPPIIPGREISVYGGYESNKSDLYRRPVFVQFIASKRKKQSKKKEGGQQTEASSESHQGAIISQDDQDSAENESPISETGLEGTVEVRTLRCWSRMATHGDEASDTRPFLPGLLQLRQHANARSCLWK